MATRQPGDTQEGQPSGKDPMQARSRLAMSWVLFPAAIVFVVALVFALKAVL